MHDFIDVATLNHHSGEVQVELSVTNSRPAVRRKSAEVKLILSS